MSQTTMPSLCYEATQQDPTILSEEVGCESSSCPLVDSKGREIRKCPRCDSINTKFCYYNNQRVAQPRHFCKSCRRYWTHGGSLRDVPIGGASRTNKPKPSPQNGTIEEENKRPFSSSSTHSNEEVKDIIPSFFDPIFASDSASSFGDGVNSLMGDELPLLGGSASSSGFMNLLLSGGVECSEAFSFGSHYSFSQLLNPSDIFDAPEITLSEEVGIFEGL